MLSQSSSYYGQVLALDVVGALLVHAIYKRTETEPVYAISTSLLLLSIPSIATRFLQADYASIASAALVSFSVFYSTLVASIVVYRLSPFHPLAQYPGPLLAKVSKFYGIYVMASGKNHIFHKRTHEKYGPYVRVGPNELSVLDGENIPNILGASGLPRGPYWDGRRNPYAKSQPLITMRDPQEHSRRRKPWNRAFNTTAVKDYEPGVQKRALQLMRELEKRAKSGDVLNLTDWMKSFTFDFMGDMIFGGGFDTLRNGAKSSPVMHSIEAGMKFLALIHHIPWITKLIYLLPGATKTVDTLRNYAIDRVKQRQVEGSNSKDVYFYLSGDAIAEKERPTEAELVSDGLTAIVAGYDTTAVVLTSLFYYVLGDKEVYARLQKEVDGYFQSVDSNSRLESSNLAALPYLNAVINEALRLGCPANILQRGTTNKTGARWLNNNFIPENTALDVPLYALMRSPKYFSPAPEEFHPERFLESNIKKTEKQEEDSGNSARTNLAAFIPFSFGPANCAGRALALAELRVVTALMIYHFDVRVDDGYDRKEWERDLEDWYVMTVGRLPVKLSLRTPVID